MINLVLDLYLNTPNIYNISYRPPEVVVRCDSMLVPPVVCARWKEYKKDGVKYYLRLTGSEPFLINRCTYLANKLGKPFVYREDQKYCADEE